MGDGSGQTPTLATRLLNMGQYTVSPSQARVGGKMMAMIGWFGVLFGFFVAPAQLLRILRTGETRGISLCTYIFLLLALTCYLIHAIMIQDPTFIVAQAINIISNAAILIILLRRRGG